MREGKPSTRRGGTERGPPETTMLLGDFLRQLRRSQRLTLAQLGAEAGVSLVTLSRWETGVFQPRLAELETVLRALGATSAQWERALALVEAPRAVARLREEAEARKADLVELAGHAPVIGDLLRAMRMRRRRTGEQVAAGLGVTPRSVRRWEGSESALPEERLDDLCRLLGATPEERVALSQRRLWLWTPGQDAPLSLEAAEQQCARFAAQANDGQTALMDLRLLCLEAQLWRQATRSAAARRVLAHAFTAHGWFLETSGRGGEVRSYADRALDLLVGQFAPERWWFDAVHSTGFALVPHLGALRERRQVEYLRRWLDFTDDPFWQTGLYRDMAQYAAAAGDIEAALGWIGRAETLAERLEDPTPQRLARHVHVSALLAAGRPAEALPLLASEAYPDLLHQRLYEVYHWVEVLLALGERSTAQDWLNRAYALCQEYGLSTEGTDALAQRF
jgi:transcriptional regulator with XRE-family HTH domain